MVHQDSTLIQQHVQTHVEGTLQTSHISFDKEQDKQQPKFLHHCKNTGAQEASDDAGQAGELLALHKGKKLAAWLVGSPFGHEPFDFIHSSWHTRHHLSSGCGNNNIILNAYLRENERTIINERTLH